MPFTIASPKLMSGSTAKYSGADVRDFERAARREDREPRQAGEIEGERCAHEHGHEEIDEVIVRQSRVD